MLKLETIIEESGKSKKEIAVMLFPGNQYPKMALKRVMDGEGSLTAEQVERLATYLDCNVQNLFQNDWTMKATKKAFIFRKQDLKGNNYKAVLDMETGKTRLFANQNMLYETILHSKTVTLSAYIKIINRLINT